MARKKRFTEEDSLFDFDEDDGYLSSTHRGEFLDSFGDEDAEDWDILDEDSDSRMNYDNNWMDYNGDSSYAN